MATHFCIADAVADRTQKTLLVMETRERFAVYMQKGAETPKRVEGLLDRQTAVNRWAQILKRRFAALMSLDDAARLAERRIATVLE